MAFLTSSRGYVEGVCGVEDVNVAKRPSRPVYDIAADYTFLRSLFSQGTTVDECHFGFLYDYKKHTSGPVLQTQAPQRYSKSQATCKCYHSMQKPLHMQQMKKFLPIKVPIHRAGHLVNHASTLC